MTSCRGILVAGVTNQARTQIAEGLLRGLTSGRVFVQSGGVRHAAALHPLAVCVMDDIGLDIRGQSVTSLEGAYRQRATYDVYVSIDAPYRNRRADRFQRRQCDVASEDDDGRALYSDPLLALDTPAHWAVACDAADARQRWRLWSPRDPAIFHENSTRKFQDDLYEGEPLFMQLETSPLRGAARVRRVRWQINELATRYAMERTSAQLRRFQAARRVLAARCVELLRDLETYYGETLLSNDALLARLSEQQTNNADSEDATSDASSSSLMTPPRVVPRRSHDQDGC